MSAFKFEVWPTEFRHITQHFGANPQNYAQFNLPGHEGVDIMAPTRTKIFAVTGGRVKMVETNPANHPYGIHIRIEHTDGYETIYAHFDEAAVQPNATVQAGDLIGLSDNTGNSFGSHLHITLKKKDVQIGNWPRGFMDPTPFLLPLMGWQRPAGPYVDGWAYTTAVVVQNELAQVSPGGINLRTEPSVNASLIDLVPGGTILIVTGPPRGFYTPVRVPRAALSNTTPEPP
ncbi:MAG: M23 family metallopeptidase, partial [Anaerolineales bacterium]|nr:M23 family metallopeptidase [Anaerolineales bacterium]